jgi:hypothetical protein
MERKAQVKDESILRHMSDVIPDYKTILSKLSADLYSVPDPRYNDQK